MQAAAQAFTRLQEPTRAGACARALFKFLREQDALQPPALPEPACDQENQCAAGAQREPGSSREAAEAAPGTQGPAYALSRHLWASVNPGYIPPAGRPQCSTQRADYAWDSAEARRAAAQHPLALATSAPHVSTPACLCSCLRLGPDLASCSWLLCCEYSAQWTTIA